MKKWQHYFFLIKRKWPWVALEWSPPSVWLAAEMQKPVSFSVCQQNFQRSPSIRRSYFFFLLSPIFIFFPLSPISTSDLLPTPPIKTLLFIHTSDRPAGGEWSGPNTAVCFMWGGQFIPGKWGWHPRPATHETGHRPAAAENPQAHRTD